MDTLPIVYDVTEAVLTTLREKQNLVLIENPNIESVKANKREVAKLRTAIEKHRVKLNEDAQLHIKNVNLKAKEAQAPVAVIEDKYAKVIEEYDANLQRLADEAATKEAARIESIKSRIANIKLYRNVPCGNYPTSKEIQENIDDMNRWLAETCDFDYGEFGEEASQAFIETEAIQLTALNARKAFEDEQEKLEIQRKLDEENRAKFEAEKAAFAEQQRAANERLEAERLQLQKAKDDAEKIEREKAEAEAAKYHAAFLLKQKEEADKLAAEELRKQNEMAETIRLRQLEIQAENERIKLEHEKDTKLRNASQQLFNALEGLIACDLRATLTGGCSFQIDEAHDAYTAAGGDLDSLDLS